MSRRTIPCPLSHGSDGSFAFHCPVCGGGGDAYPEFVDHVITDTMRRIQYEAQRAVIAAHNRGTLQVPPIVLNHYSDLGRDLFRSSKCPARCSTCKGIGSLWTSRCFGRTNSWRRSDYERRRQSRFPLNALDENKP